MNSKPNVSDIHEAGSITTWIERLKEGDTVASREIANRYFENVERFASQRLRGQPQALGDGEDIALSSINALLTAVNRGQYQSLASRKELWALLLEITRNRIRNHLRREKSQRRGGGVLSIPLAPMTAGNRDDPATVVCASEELKRLIDLLPDHAIRLACTLRLDGHDNRSIADRLGVSLPTIERYLRKVREVWSKELDT